MSTLRRIVRIIGFIFIICFILILIGAHSLLVLPFLLAFGWISFIGTVIPQIDWNWNAIIFSGLCAIGFVVGWHLLASWLRKSMRPENPIWPWRWTIITSLGVFIIFSAAISVIGLIHQITWLATTKEPMSRSDFLFHPSHFMRELESATLYKLRDKTPPLAISGTDMRQEIPHALVRFREPNVRVLILSDEHDSLTGAVIDFRETRLGKRHPYLCYRWDITKQTMQEIAVEPDRLLEFIANTEKSTTSR